MRTLQAFAGVGIALCLLCSCAKKPPLEPGHPGPFQDAASLFDWIRQRSAPAARVESSVQARLRGASAPYQGRFYGSMVMERFGEDSLAMLLQAYNAGGLPVLELITRGERLQVYSPMSSTVYANFSDVFGKMETSEFPLTSFEDVYLPVELVVEQLKLFWGLGLSDRYRYELSALDDRYLVSEWQGDVLQREMIFSVPGPLLQEVKVYLGGTHTGGMSCADYPLGEAGFIPREITFCRGDVILDLSLSRIRIKTKPGKNPVEFRLPETERHVILTPPVP